MPMFVISVHKINALYNVLLLMIVETRTYWEGSMW